MVQSVRQLLDVRNRATVHMPSLGIVVNQGGGYGKTGQQNIPIHRCGVRMWSSREERENKCQNQETQGNCVDGQASPPKVKSRWQKRLSEHSSSSDTSDGHDIRCNSTNLSNRNDNVECYCWANDDEAEQRSDKQSCHHCVQRNIPTRADLKV